MRKSVKSQVSRVKAFTLIELLVVIAIIGLLVGIMLVALGGARASGRDTKRQGDIQQIRTALEQHRSDCKEYPASVSFGSGTSIACSGNTYLSPVPNDPQATARSYYYRRISTTSYELCAALEQVTASAGCGGTCGSGVTCTHRTTSP